MGTKKSCSIDQATIDRLIKEGRGQGSLTQYRPWKIVQGTPSKKTMWRELGWRIAREYHFFTPLEWNYFCVQEWSRLVVDCREHMPLLPIEHTLAIAEECRIEHPSRPSPVDPKHMRHYTVMTTTFLLTVFDGAKQKDIARTVLYSNDIEKPSFPLTQLEIQRRYWAARDIEWAIVTEREIPAILAKNVDTIYKRRFIQQYVQLPQAEIDEIAADLTDRVQRQSGETLRKIAVRCDADHALEAGSCINIAWYLVATRQWQVDMMQILLDPAQPLSLLGADLISTKQEEAA